MFKINKTEGLFALLSIIVPIIFLLVKIGSITLGVYFGYHGGDDAGSLFGTRMIMEHGYSFYVGNFLGYPFGIDWRMFPPSDIVMVGLIKFFALFVNDPAAVNNLLYIMSFPMASFVMYIVLRNLNINIYIALIVAVLFSFIPFHIVAIGHLGLNFFYTVPIGIYYAIKLATEEDYVAYIFSNKKRLILHTAILLFSMQVNLYFIVFFLLIIGIGVVSYILQKGLSLKTFKIFYIGLVLFIGVGLNLFPTIAVKFTDNLPPALNINTRSISDSEIYGGRLAQLLLPIPGHRSESFSNITSQYYEAINHTYVTENIRQYLGLISGVAFLISLLWLLRFKNDKLWQKQLTFLSVLNVGLFFWLTIGGFGILFSLVIYPAVRCWNRLSIAINGVSLIFVAVALQMFLTNYIKQKQKQKYVFYVALTFLFVFGLWDQAIPVSYYNKEISNKFEQDKTFYKDIASALPLNSPVYQLPYVPLPYGAGSNAGGYSPLLTYAYAPSLRWNIGDLTQSKGSNFYLALEKIPIDKQIEVIKAMGFMGIVINKTFYRVEWEDMYKQLKDILGEPTMVNEDKSIYFFNIPGNVLGFDVGEDFSNQVIHDILSNVFYDLDFTQDIFIQSRGLSAKESWGRWSYGNELVLKFPLALPDKFKLEIIGQGFADNAVKATRIVIGNKEYSAVFDGNPITINVEEAKQGDSIVFYPPHPVAPKDIMNSQDSRVLGIGLIKLKISPDKVL